MPDNNGVDVARGFAVPAAHATHAPHATRITPLPFARTTCCTPKSRRTLPLLPRARGAHSLPFCVCPTHAPHTLLPLCHTPRTPLLHYTTRAVLRAAGIQHLARARTALFAGVRARARRHFPARCVGLFGRTKRTSFLFSLPRHHHQPINVW